MSQYLKPGHIPHAKSFAEFYPKAYEELLIPPVSSQLRRFSKLNHLIGGLRPYEFSILCGSTGAGKTTLMANISADLAEQGIPHYVASVETGPTDYMKRIMSVYAAEDWNSGDPVPVQKAKNLHAKFGSILAAKNQYLALYDNRISLELLLADLYYMAEVNGAKLAILDNFNFFMECVKASDERQEMDRVVHELVMFCKRVPMHIIMVMHPKKTEHGRVESEFDIKGSSTSVQEAQNVFLFNRAHPDLIKSGAADAMSREIKIAKVRRRGKWTGHRLLIHSRDGTSYTEGDVVR